MRLRSTSSVRSSRSRWRPRSFRMCSSRWVRSLPTVVFAGLVGAITWSVGPHSPTGFRFRAPHVRARGGSAAGSPDTGYAGWSGRCWCQRCDARPCWRSSWAPLASLSATGSLAGSGPARLAGLSARSGRLRRLACARPRHQQRTKTMGVLTLALITNGNLAPLGSPAWVIVSAATHGGDLLGGWRIIRTMGTRISQNGPRPRNYPLRERGPGDPHLHPTFGFPLPRTR